MVIGLQTSCTANILTKPISKYIIVVKEVLDAPIISPANIKNTILKIITKANGIAFVRAVCKKVPLIGFLFFSNVIKNDVYASIAKSIRVICIGINGNSIFVIIQKIDNNIEYIYKKYSSNFSYIVNNSSSFH